MKVAVRYGDKVTVPRVRLGTGLVGYAALHKQSVNVADVSADPRYIKVVDDARSELVIPLLLKDRCIGVLDLESFVKTTGGRGLHVVVPLTPSADWTECLEFARALAMALVRRDAHRFTERFAKAARQDKILIDYLRNNRTNTAIAAFSTRAKPAAPVSMPLAWNELSAAVPPDTWTIKTVPRRLARLRSDPWKMYWTSKQRIPRNAVRALEAM